MPRRALHALDIVAIPATGRGSQSTAWTTIGGLITRSTSKTVQRKAMFDLNRFKHAQERAGDGFAAALSELRAGHKRGHWIWYIFPQLAVLGRSSTAVHYGIHGPEEATAYLRDPVLRERLLLLTNTVAEHLRARPAALEDLMGSHTDALKLVSSMTLFREVARRLHGAEPLSELVELHAQADAILRVAATQGFAACGSTLEQLGP